MLHGPIKIKILSDLLYAFIWLIPRRLNCICRRFGTLCLFHLHRQVGMKGDWGWECWEYLYGKRFGSKIAWAYRLFPYKYSQHSQPQSPFIPTRLWRWNRQSVPKRRHSKFRRRGNTQKKAYNIQDRAEVWNQQFDDFFPRPVQTRDGVSGKWSSL